MYEKLENCPSCDHPKFDNFLICKDHTVSDESFALVKCTNCGLLFTNPRPKEEQLGKYYESQDYISHTDKAKDLISLIYKSVRKYTLNQKKNLIQEYTETGTLLDYGCGTGDFLNTCKKSGWTIRGIEVNKNARSIAIKKTNSEIFNDIDEIKKKEKFDVITAWHVIEHVSELKPTIKKLRKKLVKGGYMIVALPNYESYDSSYYKEFWAGYDVPRHLYHFSKESLKYLIKKSKLQLIDIKPMKFDSFYVSLLSEKYLTKKSNLLKAFQIGLKSNQLAKKNNNYSSLIYIITK